MVYEIRLSARTKTYRGNTMRERGEGVGAANASEMSGVKTSALS